jgi:hypothetical protein
MNINELQRALGQLRLGGMAAVLWSLYIFRYRCLDFSGLFRGTYVR